MYCDIVDERLREYKLVMYCMLNVMVSETAWCLDSGEGEERKGGKEENNIR